MKYISMTVKVKAVDELYGTVEDEIWEKYQNGEISARQLYEDEFVEIASTNLDYEVTEIKEIEE